MKRRKCLPRSCRAPGDPGALPGSGWGRAAGRGLRAGRGLSWGGGCAPGFQKTQTRIIAQRPPGRAGGERGPQGQPGGDTEARGAGDPEARRRERRGADSVALTGRGGQRAPLLLPPHVVGVQPRSPAGRSRPARRAGRQSTGASRSPQPTWPAVVRNASAARGVLRVLWAAPPRAAGRSPALRLSSPEPLKSR